MWKNPCLLVDAYKLGHYFMQPSGVKTVYSTWTARSNKYHDDCKNTVVFGQQYFINRYLVDFFNKEFFSGDIDRIRKDFEYKVSNTFNTQYCDFGRFQALYDLGYLPIAIYGVPEGTLLDIRVPDHVIFNTHPDFAWLPQYLEDIWSCHNWLPSTSATTSYYRRKDMEQWFDKTSDNSWKIRSLCGDFSMRGMTSEDAAYISTAGHLLSFDRTATTDGNGLLQQYYYASLCEAPPGLGTPSLEHSVVCQGVAYFKDLMAQCALNDKQLELLSRTNHTWDINLKAEMLFLHQLITKIQPNGVLSYVSDTYDFWGVITKILPALKPEILARDGKLVIRPDSGDPVRICSGTDNPRDVEYLQKGAVWALGQIFGTTINSKGYHILDSHIGLIYGDAITANRAKEIAARLHLRTYSIENINFGIGAYTFQYVTRDTRGYAIKATCCEIEDIGELPLYKDPKTDDGTKKSPRGAIVVRRKHCDCTHCKGHESYECIDGFNIMDAVNHPENIMVQKFFNGETMNEESIYKIRDRLWGKGAF